MSARPSSRLATSGCEASQATMALDCLNGGGGGVGRLPDWPERLDAVVTSARNRPFAWGAHDCITFAAACIAATTGIDPLAGHALWGSAAEAAAAIRRTASGRQSLRAAIGRTLTLLAWPAVDPAGAGRGDLCLVAGGQGHFAAVCLGSRLAAPGPKGLVLIQVDRALAAWRIG